MASLIEVLFEACKKVIQFYFDLDDARSKIAIKRLKTAHAGIPGKPPSETRFMVGNSVVVVDIVVVVFVVVVVMVDVAIDIAVVTV